MESNYCPCGTGADYINCCGRFLEHKMKPETAEELMRSRYSAYVLKKYDYIVETTHPQARKGMTIQDLESGSGRVKWERLEVVSFSQGQKKDKMGKVEFKAYYFSPEAGMTCMHELSRFKRYNGKWYYLDGITPEGGAGRR